MYKILIAGIPVSNCQECNVSASSARDINSLPENLLLADTSVWAPAHRCTIIINQYSEPPLLRTGPNWINYVQFFFPNLTLLKEVIHKMGSNKKVQVTVVSTTSPRPAVSVKISKDGTAWLLTSIEEISLGVFKIVSEEVTIRFGQLNP